MSESIIKVRICIIGNGVFANKVHYPILFAMGDVDVVGICAFNEKRLRETAERFNLSDEAVYVAKSRDDYQMMLDKLRPNGVYVIGQPGLMFSCWVWCLQNQFNLFIEKPLGTTIHQARILAHLAEKHRCITQVSFQRRSAPVLKRIHQDCLKKGPIVHATVEFHKLDPLPMLNGRDRMFDDYVHAVDTARWICGGEVVQITSQCRRLGVPDINWISAMLHFDNGATCYVASNWTSGRRIFRVSIHAPGICGEVEIEKEAFLYADNDVEGIHYDTREVAGSDDPAVYGGYRQKSDEFIRSLTSGREETSSPFSDALKTMEICETILAQAQLART